MRMLWIAIAAMACKSDPAVVVAPDRNAPKGIAVTRDAPIPQQNPTNAVVDLSLQDEHACLREATGTVKCWGRNASGEVGDGTSIPDEPFSNVRHQPTPVKGTVAAGNLHTAMLLSWVVHDDGTVTAWGMFQHIVGSKVETWSHLVPTRWVLPPVREIAIGSGFHCVRGVDDVVQCAGNGGAGQLADGHDSDGTAYGHLELAPATAIGRADQIVAVGNDACARIAGSVTCWGASWGVDHGVIDHHSIPAPPGRPGSPAGAPRPPPHPQPGNPHRIDRKPVRLALANIERLITGSKEICALDKDGVAWCWAADSGNLPTNPTPAKLELCKGPLSQVMLGSERCAQQRDGNVCCVDRYGPIDTSRLRGADHLGMAGFFVCGLVDQQLRCAARGNATESKLFAAP